MGRREIYRNELRGLGHSTWFGYLCEHSGLPGPRANLELLQAVADAGDARRFDEMIATDEEYLVACGVVGLGRLLAAGAGGDIADRLRLHAVDPRWRVREAVAMALQRLGDADADQLFEMAEAWAADPHPLVQRAAIAGVCEPRLLRHSETAAQAIEICDRVSQALADRPAEQRREPEVRSLRQALGYCWSVAVAADPTPGLVKFHALSRHNDPDIAWIVRSNAKKSRLAKLL